MQVQIRQLGGGDVSLDDCANLSGSLGEAIESSELLQEQYVLEVSSPGIGDQLQNDRDFQTFRGFPVEVKIKTQNGADINRTGLLLERSDDHVHINIKGRISRILRKDVISVRLTNPKG